MSTKTLQIHFRENFALAHAGDNDLSPRITSLSSLSHENLDDEEHRAIHIHAKHQAPALQKDTSNNHLNYSGETTLKTPLPFLSPKETTLQQISYTLEQRIEQVQKGEHIELCTSAPAQDLTKGVEELQDISGKAYSSFTKSYKKLEEGKLEMINTVLLKKQKQVLGFLIKQFGSMLFSGKSVMNISLPITIFEPRTLLEKIADSFAFAPHFLEKAALATDTLEQFKLAFAYFVTNLSSDLNPQKPCNPAIGETFQGIIGGCPVYVEQISSQPPLAAFQMIGKGFTLEGNSELQASISVNSVKCRRVGSYKIIFKNTGSTIHVQFPDGIMNGTAFGKRVWSFSRKLQVYDPQNYYYAELDFDKNESSKKKKEISGYFSNGIHQTTEKFMMKAMQDLEKAKDADIKFKEKEHSVLKLADFEGSWLEFLAINGEEYWRYANIWPYKVQYFDNPLPSDSNFRCDLLYLKNNEEDKAQEAKMSFEELQRGDKKLREAGKAKRR